jgi:hypothetical protein
MTKTRNRLVSRLVTVRILVLPADQINDLDMLRSIRTCDSYISKTYQNLEIRNTYSESKNASI